MIRSRCCASDDGGPTTIRPSDGFGANAAMPLSISAASRTPIEVNSTPNDDAAVWTAANPPDPAGTAGSRNTATRVTAGAIFLSSSSHFPPRLNSQAVNPVALLAGRARLATKPEPTGSIVITNTIGTVRLACWNAPTIEPAVAIMTPGASATNSSAYLRKRSRSPAPQRYSICTFVPMIQPRSCSPFSNAEMRPGASGSSVDCHMSTPMRRTRPGSGCWARTASGHAAAAPPITLMNSRRLMGNALRPTPDPTTGSDSRRAQPALARHLVRDANVRVRDMETELLDVIQTLVNICTRPSLTPDHRNGFESSPRRELLRQIVAVSIGGESEDATESPKNVNLHL